MLAGAGTGAWLAVMADDAYLANAIVLVTVVAGAVLAAGLVLRIPLTIPAAVLALGAGYVAILVFETEALDARAPLFAAALLAVAELAYWSLDLSRPVADEPGTTVRGLALLATLLLGTVALGVAVLALVESVSAGGAAVEIVGALAEIGALTLLAFAARQTRSY